MSNQGPPAGAGFRITPDGYMIATSVFLATTVMSLILTLIFRVRRTRLLTSINVLIFLSLIYILISAGFAYSMRDDLYRVARSALRIDRAPLTGTILAPLLRRLQISSALIWAGLYLAKHAFLSSFQPAIAASPRRALRIWFYAVQYALVAFMLASMPMGLAVCRDFNEATIQTSCPVSTVTSMTRLYLSVTAVLDIASTVAVASVPALTLGWDPQPATSRKGLAAATVLAILLVLAPVLRAALAGMPGATDDSEGTDLTLVVFFFGLEASLVSAYALLPSFRSLFPLGCVFPQPRSNSPSPSRDIEMKGADAGLRSESRVGVLMTETVKVEEEQLEEGREVPPTPNRVSIRKTNGERVSKLTEEEWKKLVNGQMERKEVEGFEWVKEREGKGEEQRTTAAVMAHAR